MEPRTPTCRTGVTLQRLGREAILYDRRNGRAHVVNDLAGRIWELCDGQATLDQIASAFAGFYNLPVSAVYDDVVQIIASFRELHVLD